MPTDKGGKAAPKPAPKPQNDKAGQAAPKAPPPPAQNDKGGQAQPPAYSYGDGQPRDANGNVIPAYDPASQAALSNADSLYAQQSADDAYAQSQFDQAYDPNNPYSRQQLLGRALSGQRDQARALEAPHQYDGSAQAHKVNLDRRQGQAVYEFDQQRNRESHQLSSNKLAHLGEHDRTIAAIKGQSASQPVAPMGVNDPKGAGRAPGTGYLGNQGAMIVNADGTSRPMTAEDKAGYAKANPR